MRSPADPGGSWLWRPVPLSLHNNSGGCSSDDASSGDGAARYACSYLEKSGWIIPFGVASSSCDLGSPAVLVVSDPVSLDDDMAGGHHCLLGRSVLHVHIGESSVPIVATLKLCGLFGSFFVEMGIGFKLQARRLSLPGAAFRRFERWLRLPATKTTRRPLQGLRCNFFLSVVSL